MSPTALSDPQEFRSNRSCRSQVHSRLSLLRVDVQRVFKHIDTGAMNSPIAPSA
jgi:hypothetical protein